MTESENMGIIHDLIGNTTNTLLAMTKEQRIQWFERSMYNKPLKYKQEIDGTLYLVRTFFDETADESIVEKLERITTKE